jgi:hypothetical protein
LLRPREVRAQGKRGQECREESRVPAELIAQHRTDAIEAPKSSPKRVPDRDQPAGKARVAMSEVVELVSHDAPELVLTENCQIRQRYRQRPQVRAADLVRCRAAGERDSQAVDALLTEGARKPGRRTLTAEAAPPA